jgi:Domain of unknown function (DUF1877)
MACRGVFFALSSSQKEHLLSLDSDEKRLTYIQEEIEEPWDEAHLLETDKAWDAIHRCLTDGTLAVARSSTPLGKLILGGVQLYSDTQIYIVNLTDSSELPEISIALRRVTKEWLKERYDQLRGTDYSQEFISEQDWEYTWDWFSGIPDFVNRAVQEGRSIIFTVDQ